MQQEAFIKSKAMSACLLWTCVLTLAASANEPVQTLDQLRERYEETHDVYARTESPEMGKPGFREKLTVWAKARREFNGAAQAFMSALLPHWMKLSDDTAEEVAVRDEIQAVYKGMAGKSLTEHRTNMQSFLVRASWPVLTNEAFSKKKAMVLVKLTDPQFNVRISDGIARLGIKTEPYGWNIHAGHALALIRSGKEWQASEEIKTLHAKVSNLHKANPKGRLDYGPKAGEGRYRDYIDYLQLCELLHGLQAAISSKHEDAAKRIANAAKLRDTFSTEASLLVAEIARRGKVASLKPQTER